MSPTALLILAAVASFGPALLSFVLGGTEAAWFYVCSAVEASTLWAFVGLTAATLTARSIAAWGLFEGAQRSTCRLVFPMDHPVMLRPGQGLCEAAFGFPTTWASVLAALFVAALAQEEGRAVKP